MPNLLNQNHLDQIHAALGDVMDTFLNLPCTYTVTGTRLQLFNEDDTNTDDTTKNLLALAVWDKNDADAQVTFQRQGAVDFSEGYLLFSFDALKALGCIDVDGNPIFEAEEDSLVVQNVEYEIRGANVLGQLERTVGALAPDFKLVKVHIRHRQKPAG